MMKELNIYLTRKARWTVLADEILLPFINNKCHALKIFEKRERGKQIDWGWTILVISNLIGSSLLSCDIPGNRDWRYSTKMGVLIYSRRQSQNY